MTGQDRELIAFLLEAAQELRALSLWLPERARHLAEIAAQLDRDAAEFAANQYRMT